MVRYKLFISIDQTRNGKMTKEHSLNDEFTKQNQASLKLPLTNVINGTIVRDRRGRGLTKNLSMLTLKTSTLNRNKFMPTTLKPKNSGINSKRQSIIECIKMPSIDSRVSPQLIQNIDKCKFEMFSH